MQTQPTPRLCQWRLQRVLSQAELASLAGVGRTTIRRAEAGHAVSAQIAERLARALDVTTRWLAHAPAVEVRLQRAGEALHGIDGEGCVWTLSRFAAGPQVRCDVCGTPIKGGWHAGERFVCSAHILADGAPGPIACEESLS